MLTCYCLPHLYKHCCYSHKHPYQSWCHLLIYYCISLPGFLLIQPDLFITTGICVLFSLISLGYIPCILIVHCLFILGCWSHFLLCIHNLFVDDSVCCFHIVHSCSWAHHVANLFPRWVYASLIIPFLWLYIPVLSSWSCKTFYCGVQSHPTTLPCVHGLSSFLDCCSWPCRQKWKTYVSIFVFISILLPFHQDSIMIIIIIK